MYFDLARRKIAALAAIALALGAGVFLFFVVVGAEAGPLARAGEYAARARSLASYWALFKFPRDVADALLATTGRTGATAPAENAAAQSVPVLLYHGEGSSASTMPLGTFVDQMRALKADGWRTVTLPQFEAFMRGAATLPDKSFLLTFDDGRKDTFYAADPVLADEGFTAVMFVITGLSLPDAGAQTKSGFYLSKDELADMARSGRWDIESHGKEDHLTYAAPSATSTAVDYSAVAGAHFLSNRFWLANFGRMETTREFSARVTNDLADAKRTLETDFGKPVTAFAYPFNDFGEDTVNFPGATAALGGIVPTLYDFAFYQTWPGNGDSFNYPGAGYLVKRLEPANEWSGADLVRALDRARAKLLPYDAASFGAEWNTNWGTVTTGATLSLSAPSDTTGSAAFLDGTESWREYVVTAEGAVGNGTLSILARHTETDAPYLVCAFSENRIYLEEHSGATQTTLKSARYAPPTFPAPLSVSMRVSGTNATCSAYGASASASVPDISRNGGVGVSVWDPTPGAARAQLTHFTAAKL